MTPKLPLMEALNYYDTKQITRVLHHILTFWSSFFSSSSVQMEKVSKGYMPQDLVHKPCSLS
jgi:hypothetical protein